MPSGPRVYRAGILVDVHAEQVPQLIAQFRSREQHVVVGAVGKPADQPGPEPVVLPFVGGSEGAAGERTGHVQGVDHRVRIRRQGENGRNTQLGGDRRGGHAAHVRHPQMQ